MIRVFPYLIYHRHEADRPGPEEGAGKNWFLVANGMQLLEFFFRKKKANNSEHDGDLGMYMLILEEIMKPERDGPA